MKTPQKTKKITMTVTTDEWILEKMRKLADRDRRSLSLFVTIVLEDYLQKIGEGPE